MWLIIEINTVLFLSILFSMRSPSKSITKYFIIQATASITIVLGLVLISSDSSFSLFLVQGSLVVKLGAIPGHIWYISLIQDLSWVNILILSTIQKLIPLVMLSSLSSYMIIISFILISRIRGLLATKSISLKRLIAYSGVLNVSWFITSVISVNCFCFYFSCYFVTIAGLAYSFSSNSASLTLDTKSGMSFRESLAVGFFLLALGGLPPFINFWAKLIRLKIIIFRSLVGVVVGFILVIITAWLIFVYLGLIDKFILKNNSFNFKTLKFYTSKSIIFLSIPLAGCWFIL